MKETGAFLIFRLLTGDVYVSTGETVMTGTPALMPWAFVRPVPLIFLIRRRKKRARETRP
jgi:hypothetical protein